jgi:DNA-directed RNA polymerase specialized sigma subunit
MYSLSLSAVKKTVTSQLHRPIYKMFRAMNKESIIKRNKRNVKLNEAQAREILELYYNEELTQETIEKIYNVSMSAVGMITTGQRWKEVYEKFIQQGA